MYDARIMLPDLEAEGASILESGEDFTVYLLKKIYLENKTLEGLNEALDKDLNPVFKNEDKNYLNYSTLQALGIKLPKIEYLNSFRYTTDGYSDVIGDKISKSLAASWDALSEKEKQARLDKISNNLEAYWANLTEEDKAKISEKRRISRAESWKKLTPEEKTTAIEKMQTGSLTQKFAMINAWNNCSSIREHLSEYMKECSLHGTSVFVYRDESFSESQRRIMSGFWQKYPEDAEKLGFEISKSYEEIKTAIQEGTFEELQRNIALRQTEIKLEYKNKKVLERPNKQFAATNKADVTDIYEEFENAFKSVYGFLPKAYVRNYCDFVKANINDEKIIKLWMKTFDGAKALTSKELEYLGATLKNIKDDKKMFREKRAIEQAMIDVLYEASNKDDEAKKLFGQRYVALATIMATISSVECPEAHEYTYKASNTGELNHLMLVKAPDFSKLDELYNKYNNPPSMKTVNFFSDFIKQKYKADRLLGTVIPMEVQQQALDELGNNIMLYVSTWGASMNVMLNTESDIFHQMFEKFESLYDEGVLSKVS